MEQEFATIEKIYAHSINWDASGRILHPKEFVDSYIEISTFAVGGLEPLAVDGLSKVARWHLGERVSFQRVECYKQLAKDRENMRNEFSWMYLPIS